MFDNRKHKHDHYRGKDCIKKFYKNLKEHAMNIINYENKEMTLQTEIERESYDNQKTTTFAKKNLKLLIIKVITEL